MRSINVAIVFFAALSAAIPYTEQPGSRMRKIESADTQSDLPIRNIDGFAYAAKAIHQQAHPSKRMLHGPTFHKRGGEFQKAKLALALHPINPATMFRYSQSPYSDFSPPRSSRDANFRSEILVCKTDNLKCKDVKHKAAVPSFAPNAKIVPEGYGGYYRLEYGSFVGCRELCGNTPVAIFDPSQGPGAIVMNIAHMDPQGMIPFMTTLMTIYRDEIGPHPVAVVGKANLKGTTSPTVDVAMEALRMSGVKSTVVEYVSWPPEDPSMDTDIYGTFFVKRDWRFVEGIWESKKAEVFMEGKIVVY